MLFLNENSGSDYLWAGTTEMSEFESWYGKKLLLLHIVQTGSGVTQPPIQRIPEALYSGEKLDAHLQLVPGSRKRDLYIHSPYVFMP
jgi:hypothetical protein